MFLSYVTCLPLMITYFVGATMVVVLEAPQEDEDPSIRLEGGLSVGRSCKWLVCV